MSRKLLTTAQYTRRVFLGAAGAIMAGVAAGALSRSAAYADPGSTVANSGGVSNSGELLGDLDLPEFNLASYSQYVTKFRTAWGETVDDWYPAFSAVNNDLAARGGGRLIVPAGEYRISGHVFFDLPAVSVHLQQDSYVELVGAPDVFYCAPIGFYGNAKPGEPIENRIQREFAALIGPGAIGYPANQLHRYPHENGVGMSYIKTAIMDGIHVPNVPGKGVTAQFGCNNIVMRNCTIGTTFTGEMERNYGGQASIVAQGGWSFNRRFPPKWPLFTNVVIENNVIEGDTVRGIHASFCDNVDIVGNTLAPSWGTGMTIKAANSALVQDNEFRQTSQGFPTKTGKPFSEYVVQDGVPEDGLYFVNVTNPSLLHNRLGGHTHRHSVYSWEVASSPIPTGVIYARDNSMPQGTSAVFGGSPQWDSDEN